ncbi:S8 family serine peptidase [Streptomyces kunmingensis]|uniref:S8 family serine peptidase n=1 Tax=Streptomyces kunmingensis TaxID=68225 RepID=A0ABU6CE51_9ACTN|nr:S8 family serine peptidase [Streptomyces kunmingensis]MEB3962993.1 S8 family serine peptidase [Streptomyces kunmingensis]
MDKQGVRTSYRACVLGLVLVFSGAAVPVAAAPMPSPSPSASKVQLPVVPARLGTASDQCTKASATVMKSVPWAQRWLGLSGISRFTDGAGTVVGVVDTGVSAKAPGLSGRVAGPATDDCVGHGTFLAGTVAAAPQKGSGYTGVAPGARIRAVRGTDSTGVPSASSVAKGIREAVDGDAQVIVVAAALEKGSGALTAAVAYARKQDVVVIAPAVPDASATASDSSASPPTSFWPAADDGVVSVLDIDIDGQRPDGERVPDRADLAAPGQGVTGIGPVGKGHYLGNGPSVAAAIVAGAAALVRAYRPELSAEEVVQRLRSTSYPADVPEIDVYGALTGVASTDRPTSGTDTDHAFTPLAVVHEGPAMVRSLVLMGGCVLFGLAVWSGTVLVRRSRSNAKPGL